MTIHKRKFANRLTSGVLLLLFLVGVGCETLTFVDPNDPSVDDVGIAALATGMEAGMRNNFNTYLLFAAVVGREAYNFDPADPAWTDEVLFGPVDPGGFIVNNPWAQRYRVIQNGEIMIEKAQNDPNLAASQVAGAIGFAKTIQAYQLLLNLNSLDENGVKSDFTGVLDRFMSKTESFNFIAALLDDGNTQLGNAGSSFSFSVRGGAEVPYALSAGFAGFDTPATFAQFNRALRARVAVYMGDFQTALTALQNSFLDPVGDLQTGAYHIYGAGLGDILNPIFEGPTAPFVKFRAHPSFIADAEAGDTRVTTKTLDRTGDPTMTQVSFGVTNLSSAFPITFSSSATDPFPIIRNEELILLRAEANVGLGNFPAAEADMNIVRAAAGLAGYSGTSAVNGLDRLLHEKRYSLFVEGHRWVDMRRYGRLGDLPVDRPGDVVHPQQPRPVDEESAGS
jgi:hypothetical protein